MVAQPSALEMEIANQDYDEDESLPDSPRGAAGIDMSAIDASGDSHKPLNHGASKDRVVVNEDGEEVEAKRPAKSFKKMKKLEDIHPLFEKSVTSRDKASALAGLERIVQLLKEDKSAPPRSRRRRRRRSRTRRRRLTTPSPRLPPP